MQNNSGPKALTDYILHQSKLKADKTLLALLVQGVLAGIYISIGAIAYIKLGAGVSDPGLGAFLGALVFPVGIIAIILMQAELYTSDSMVMLAVFTRHTKIKQIIRILVFIFIANLIGAIFVAFLTQTAGIFNDGTITFLQEKAVHKVNLPVLQLLSSSILCNIIVSTGVCLAYSCKDEISKVVVVWLAITVFVLTSTEHVVANMYYLFAAYFLGADISLSQIFYNLGVAAIGNFIGGGLLVSGANFILVYKEFKEK